MLHGTPDGRKGPERCPRPPREPWDYGSTPEGTIDAGDDISISSCSEQLDVSGSGRGQRDGPSFYCTLDLKKKSGWAHAWKVSSTLTFLHFLWFWLCCAAREINQEDCVSSSDSFMKRVRLGSGVNAHSSCRYSCFSPCSDRTSYWLTWQWIQCTFFTED